MTAGKASVVEQQFESYVKAFRSLAVQRPLILLKRQICVSTARMERPACPALRVLPRHRRLSFQS